MVGYFFTDTFTFPDLILCFFRQVGQKDNVFSYQEVYEVFQNTYDTNIRQRQQLHPGVSVYVFIQKLKDLFIHYGFLFRGLFIRTIAKTDDIPVPVPFNIQHSITPHSG